MKKRRNTKRQRRITLIVKSSIFVIVICMMITILSKEKPSAPPSPLTDDASQDSSPQSNLISLHGLSQEDIPTGCESVSTVAALRHHGIDITIEDFINDFLPCENFYKKNGKVYGANPHEYFAGDPYKTASLGCYPKVILKALNEMKRLNYPGMDNLIFQDVSGSDFDTLIKEYIEKQIPVVLWVTINMKEPYDGMQYYLEDGSTYTWTAQEHCTVLCGYDENCYYIMDPLANGNIVSYPKTLVEQRYDELGRFALVIAPSP